MMFCWYNVLIVFLLYFPAIDANNSGEEEEAESDEDFIYFVEFLLDGVEEVQGQISQPMQAIYWSLIIVSHIVVTLLLLLSLDLVCVSLFILSMHVLS